MPEHPRTLLFDLDGTLIDSRRDLAGATNLLLSELGVETLPLEDIVAMVGDGARSLVRRAIAAAAPERIGQFGEAQLRGFLAHYQQVMLQSTLPFPGVVEGLNRLQDAGVLMAVVTNKPIDPTLAILEGLGLSAFFPVVLGGDSLVAKKPDPLPLREAARRLARPLPTCLMIGDSEVDMRAAEAAGIPGLWCSWGGFHPDRPRQAARRVDHFREVVAAAILG